MTRSRDIENQMSQGSKRKNRRNRASRKGCPGRKRAGAIADRAGAADPVGATNPSINWHRFRNGWRRFRDTRYAISSKGQVMNAETGQR